MCNSLTSIDFRHAKCIYFPMTYSGLSVCVWIHMHVCACTHRAVTYIRIEEGNCNSPFRCHKNNHSNFYLKCIGYQLHENVVVIEKVKMPKLPTLLLCESSYCSVEQSTGQYNGAVAELVAERCPRSLTSGSC